MKDKLTFDNNVENYDRWRPRYCDKLFNEIIDYAKINSTSNVIEVGCGTGQATEAFLKSGCNLHAVECGKNLAKYTKLKYASYSNFTIHNVAFEDYDIKPNSVNLVYSATAFHWIDEYIGYRKIYNSLIKGGTIALFWNKPFVNKKDDPLHVRIQEIYKKYRPTDKEPKEDDQEVFDKRKETILKYGFSDLQFNLFHQIRIFNADDYIALLNTYSDHAAMLGDNKEKFEKEIKDAINEYDGIIKIYDTIDLYMAKK